MHLTCIQRKRSTQFDDILCGMLILPDVREPTLLGVSFVTQVVLDKGFAEACGRRNRLHWEGHISVGKLAVVLVKIKLLPEKCPGRRRQLPLVDAQYENEPVDVEEVLDGLQEVNSVIGPAAI